MPRFRGVIFDVDGTLVDSNDAHAKAWATALKENGHEVDYQQIRRLIGMGGDNLLPEIANLEKDSEQGTAISHRRGEVFKEQYLSSLASLPGSRELVERISTDGMKLVVASSAKQDELEPLLSIAEVSDLFEQRTSSDDAPKSKPDPDIVQAALERISLTPEEAVMIGDTPYDIQSAHKAGVKVIALRSGGWSDKDLTGALAIYDDPADLLAHYDESPLVQQAAVGSPSDQEIDPQAMGDQPA
jgi:HAD superfamily hydrolase (TIGR01509 family)